MSAAAMTGHDSLLAHARPTSYRQDFLTRAAQELLCALQPLVDTQRGTIHGYEALLRGLPNLGFASPGAFLDEAARLNVLLQVEQMLLRRAAMAFRPLVAARPRLMLFVNVDHRALTLRDFPAAINAALTHADLPPEALCIEISEKQEETDQPEFAAVVADLRQRGHHIAVDDYGSGQSRLSLLLNHQADYIKIDRGLIAGVDTAPSRRAYLRSIVNLSRTLGVRLVAEGVETEAEYAACRDAGCEFVQGYFLARPTQHPEDLPDVLPHAARPTAPEPDQEWHSSTDASLLLDKAESPPPVFDDADADSLFDVFRASPHLDYYPLTDRQHRPRGLVHERTLRIYGFSEFGRALLQNTSYRRCARDFAHPCPVVELSGGIDRALEAFANSSGAPGIILTQEGRYAGVLSATALLAVLQERRLKQARDQSPLTGLPGNQAIHGAMRTLAQAAPDHRFLCHFDLDNFKAFNDHYGFHRGDRAITLLADHLRRALPSGGFIGHIGGDDFFAGLSGDDAGALRSWIERMLVTFKDHAASLHDAADRLAGGISGYDRAGMQRRFPLLRCSATVLEVPPLTVDLEPEQLTMRLAALKAEAKASPDGMAWQRLPPAGN